MKFDWIMSWQRKISYTQMTALLYSKKAINENKLI